MKSIPKLSVDYTEITEYFKSLDVKMRNRVLNITETSFVEWDAMERKEQEELLQSCMTELFTAEATTFYPAMYDAIEDYYSLLAGLNPAITNVVASFIPAMENNTVIFATHMALLDNTWVITGEHVDMAKDILYDLFKNLILWLEDEVEIGPKVAEKAAQRGKWATAYHQVEQVELGNRGDGWRMKSKVLKVYETQNDCSRGSAYNNFEKWGEGLFDKAKDGRVAFIRMKEGAE